MATIGLIDIGLVLGTKAFEKGTKKAIGGVSSLTRKLNPLAIASNLVTGAFNVLGAAAGDLLAPFLSVEGFASAVRKQFDELDQIGKRADVFNTTTSELMGLKLASDLSGVSFSSLSKGLERLLRRVGEANAGYGEGRRGLLALGLSADDLASKNTTEIFKTIADSIAELPTAAGRAQAAYSLFGRQGVELVQVLKQGGDAIQDVIDRANELHGGITREDIALIESSNDAWTEVGYSIDGIIQQASVAPAPTIKSIADTILEMGANGTGATNAVSQGMEWVGDKIAWAVDYLEVFVLGWKALKTAVLANVTVTVGALSLLGKGIQEIINLIPGVEVTFGDTMLEITKDLGKLTKETGSDLADQFAGGPSAGEKVRRFFTTVENGTEAATEAIRNSGASAAETAEEYLKLQKRGLDLVESLDMQVQTFGMSSEEAAIYKLQMEGVESSILDLARSHVKELEALRAQEQATKDAATAAEELRKAQEKLAEEAQAVFDRTRTPIEQFKIKLEELNRIKIAPNVDLGAVEREIGRLRDEVVGDLIPANPFVEWVNTVNELGRLMKEGLIDDKQFASGVLANLPSDVKQLIESTKTPLQKVQEQIDKIRQVEQMGFIDAATAQKAIANATSGLNQGRTERFASALELGSQEARSAILESRIGTKGSDPMERLAKAQEQEAKDVRKQVPILERIEKQLGRQVFATVQF